MNSGGANMFAVFGIFSGIEARPDPELVIFAGTFSPARRIVWKFDKVRNVVPVFGFDKPAEGEVIRRDVHRRKGHGRQSRRP